MTLTRQRDRIIIATEMETLNEHLVGLANTRNANGEYLFSGFKSTTQPFSKNTASGGYTYSGDANQRTLQIAENRQIADGDPGINVFGTPANSMFCLTPVPMTIYLKQLPDLPRI